MENFSREELKEIYKGLNKEQLLEELIAQARMQVERANILENTLQYVHVTTNGYKQDYVDKLDVDKLFKLLTGKESFKIGDSKIIWEKKN